MAFGSPPIPNSADRRAWLRSYHYYRSKLMEEPVGVEAMELCRPLIEADGSWTPPANVMIPPEPVVEEGAPPKKLKPGEENAKNLPPEAIAGTPAAVHHQMPFFKEGRIFADPWRLPEKAKSVLRYFVKQAATGEDSDLMIPEPELWRKWVPSVGQRGYGIASLRGYDVLRGIRMAGIMSELERLESPVIWQAGPSATIARAIKSHLSRARLVVSCAPFEMVSSVAFLRASMPDTSVAVVGSGDAVAKALDDAEIVLVPSHTIGGLDLPRLDFFLDVMSLQLAEPGAAAAQARRAYELGAMYCFALTLDGESEWPLHPATAALEPYFWLHQMPVRAVLDWQVAAMIDEGFTARGLIGRPEDIKYWKLNTHFTMGWRRLKT